MMTFLKTLLFMIFSMAHIDCFAMQWQELTLENMQEFTFAIRMPSKIEFYNHNNIIFAKASLLDNKIIVHDCLGDEKSLSTTNAILERIKNGFIGKILTAFRAIYHNQIGMRLLEDIHRNSKYPLTIFPHNFLMKNPKAESTKMKPFVLAIEPKETALKATHLETRESNLMSEALFTIELFQSGTKSDGVASMNCNLASAAVKDFFGQGGGVDFFPHDTLIDLFGTDAWQASRLQKFVQVIWQSQFIPTSAMEILRNTICIRLSEASSPTHKVYGFRLPEKKLKNALPIIDNLPRSDEVALFHELNHYRHFLLGFPTVKVQNSPEYNKFDNSSSLGIMPDKRGIMGRPEEELQLTGITTLSTMHDPIKDVINETHYRLEARYPIRFPYQVLKPHLPMGDLESVFMDLETSNKNHEMSNDCDIFSGFC